MRYIKSFARKAASSGFNYAAGRVGRSIAARSISGVGQAAQALKFNLYGKYRQRAAAMKGALTEQKDQVVLRSRGRVPKKWRKFVNKVNTALQISAPRAIYCNTAKGSTTGAADLQQWQGSFFGDLDANQGDIWNCFKDAYSLAAVADAESRKIFLRRITSSFQIGCSAGGGGAQIDLYLIVARKDINDKSGIFSQLGEYFNDLAAVGTVTVDNPTVDLFMVPNFCRYYKVLKTYKFVAPNGKTIRVEHSFKVNRYIQGKVLQDYGAMSGLTHAWLYRIRGNPSSATAGAAGLGAVDSQWAMQTKIDYQTVSGLTIDTVGQTK